MLVCVVWPVAGGISLREAFEQVGLAMFNYMTPIDALHVDDACTRYVESLVAVTAAAAAAVSVVRGGNGVLLRANQLSAACGGCGFDSVTRGWAVVALLTPEEHG